MAYILCHYKNSPRLQMKYRNSAVHFHWLAENFPRYLFFIAAILESYLDLRSQCCYYEY